ncbi:MAG: hypothetical protein JO303_18365 [Caulobacteraceae bacterium]|nr:hypothetical protein [Caulobacteraceae bacterium]
MKTQILVRAAIAALGVGAMTGAVPAAASTTYACAIPAHHVVHRHLRRRAYYPARMTPPVADEVVYGAEPAPFYPPPEPAPVYYDEAPAYYGGPVYVGAPFWYGPHWGWGWHGGFRHWR